jgi:hypothetical protein
MLRKYTMYYYELIRFQTTMEGLGFLVVVVVVVVVLL